MASTASALLCAVLALFLWGGVGWIFARRLTTDRALVLPLAPALGWAVQSVIAHVAALIGGFSWLTILGAPVLACVVVLMSDRRPPPKGESEGTPFPLWVIPVAALLALVPAAAVLPKFVDGSVFLAAPMFDHSKIALIDEILRDGVPPANPIFAEGGGAGRVAYYYLWHFSATQLANLAGASGWEADIAATWFTAFATLVLMGGFAFNLTKRGVSPAVVLVLACCGSLRPVLAWLFGQDSMDAVILPASGLAGWLFQVTWSPHHVAAAGCAMLAAWLMAQLAGRPSIFAVIVLAFVLAAGFESSIWIGGIVFVLSGSAIGFTLLAEKGQRPMQFIAVCVSAGIGAILLASPMIVEQIHAAATRGGGVPIAIDPFRVLGPFISESYRRLVDLPAYWFVLLGVEFPAILVAGVIALGAMARSKELDRERRRVVVAFIVLCAVSLFCTWLMVSTAGENNDLGWRAILPGIMVLTVAAAAGISTWLARPLALSAALAAIGLALPDGGTLAAGNVTGDPTAAGSTFAQDPEMWAAVRQHTPPDARVANNPQYLKTLTPWPVNVSWALLADRRSCWAAYSLAAAFVPLPQKKLEAISALFLRVFDGRGTTQDVAALANDYGCDVVLLTREDGAWVRDPFAANPLYRLVETKRDGWRIYVALQDAADKPR